MQIKKKKKCNVISVFFNLRVFNSKQNRNNNNNYPPIMYVYVLFYFNILCVYINRDDRNANHKSRAANDEWPEITRVAVAR